MTKKAYAKINLALRVLKETNGYHELDMLNAKIDLYDELTIEEIEENTVVVEMIPNVVDVESNLVTKVSKRIKDIYNIEKGFKITINKKIPLSSGLAGGSTDCACSINLIDEFFELKMSREEKEKIALEMGTDVVYCLYDSMCHVSGIGENVEFKPVYFPYSVIVINPICEISTKDIYSQVDFESEKLNFETTNIKELLGNDLQKIVLNNHKELIDVIEYINTQDVFGVQTSGAGATILAFVEPHKAHLVLNNIKMKYPHLTMNIYNIVKNNPNEFLDVKEKEEINKPAIGHSDVPMFDTAEDVVIDFGDEKYRTIHYVYKEDIYDLNEYVVVNKRGGKLGRYIFSLIGIAFVIIFAVKLNWIGLAASALFTIYQLFISMPLRKKTLRMEIDKKMQTDKRKMVLIVTDLGIYYAYEYETNVPNIPWEGIGEVISTNNYLFIGMATGGYLPINKHRCHNSETLTQLLKEYLSESDKFKEKTK